MVRIRASSLAWRDTLKAFVAISRATTDQILNNTFNDPISWDDFSGVWDSSYDIHVMYAMHSSHSELREFVQYLRPARVHPCVVNPPGGSTLDFYANTGRILASFQDLLSATPRSGVKKGTVLRRQLSTAGMLADALSRSVAVPRVADAPSSQETERLSESEPASGKRKGDESFAPNDGSHCTQKPDLDFRKETSKEFVKPFKDDFQHLLTEISQPKCKTPSQNSSRCSSICSINQSAAPRNEAVEVRGSNGLKAITSKNQVINCIISSELPGSPIDSVVLEFEDNRIHATMVSDAKIEQQQSSSSPVFGSPDQLPHRSSPVQHQNCVIDLTCDEPDSSNMNRLRPVVVLVPESPPPLSPQPPPNRHMCLSRTNASSTQMPRTVRPPHITAKFVPRRRVSRLTPDFGWVRGLSRGPTSHLLEDVMHHNGSGHVSTCVQFFDAVREACRLTESGGEFLLDATFPFKYNDQ
ncbi:hypothetical protein HDU83_001887 [Entophlyctis luteolus]|nr:hypothetical protein HDU83_001887 [Entophlyctis luteolus]